MRNEKTERVRGDDYETMIKLRERAYTTPGLASTLVKLVMSE